MKDYFRRIDYKIIDEKTAYKGRRITIKEMKFDTGKQEIYREHVLAGDAVAIVAITEDNNLIMIQEPRTAVERVVLDIPAGKIEVDEDPEDAAIRELEEETGYRAKYMKKLRDVYPSVGYSNEKLTICLAKDLEKTKTHLDFDEDIEVIKIPIKEAKEMLDNNKLKTLSSVLGLMHYFMYIDE